MIGDRAHILLLLSNVSLAPGNSSSGGSSGAVVSDPIRISTVMSWIGSAPDQAHRALSEPVALWRHQMHLNCSYAQSAVVIPASFQADALQVQQVVMFNLPQGPGAATAVQARGRGLPREVFTVLMWSFERWGMGG